MNKEGKKSTLSFDQKQEIMAPMSRNYHVVDVHDWGRLKRYSSRPMKGLGWLSYLIGGFVAIGLTCGYDSYKAFVANEDPLTPVMFSFGAIIISLILIIIDLRYSTKSAFDRNEIQECIEDIESSFVAHSVGPPTNLIGINSYKSWTAINKPDVKQGVDFKETPLQGKSLKRISFKVSSEYTYLRAGLRLIGNPAIRPMPSLLGSGSLLFHVGRKDDGSCAITIYPDGTRKSAKSIPIDDLYSGEFRFDIEVQEPGTIDFSVNNITERLNSVDMALLNNVYLAAWGDGKDYVTKFYDIDYVVE